MAPKRTDRARVKSAMTASRTFFADCIPKNRAKKPTWFDALSSVLVAAPLFCAVRIAASESMFCLAQAE